MVKRKETNEKRMKIVFGITEVKESQMSHGYTEEDWDQFIGILVHFFML